MLIDKKLPSPMYPNSDMSNRSKRNHWFVREKGSDQPNDQSWYDWWKSRSLGEGKNGHIAWRSTCIAKSVPDPFNPKIYFEVEFKAPDGNLYNLAFTLAPHGPNK
ncbi:hypothetical protein A936_09078 [Enterobacter sp. Ag1]|nr:hypothetical protein A936_09078 [Enterobacter sp. Ag1]